MDAGQDWRPASAAFHGRLSVSDALKELIRDVPDFPKPGIVFKDISPLLSDAKGLAQAVRSMAEPFRGEVDLVVGIESRGFIFGAPMATELGVGFVPVRKPGKLPGATRSVSYELEYGTDSLEIQVDAIGAGQRVVLVDDLLATGGTIAAGLQLLGESGATVVGVSFLIELGFLDGRSRLPAVPLHSLIRYD